MTEPDIALIKELIARVFRILAARSDFDEVFITRIFLQKVLYALRCKLPESNYVRAHLAYYWYKAGPYSEYVQTALNELMEAGDIEPKGRGSWLLTLAKSASRKRFYRPDKPLLEAIALLGNIVPDVEDRGVGEEVKDQYWLDAPLKFHPRFRFDVLPQLSTIVSCIQAGKPVSADKLIELKETLQTASGSLPNVSVFSEFKRVYFDYTYCVTKLIDSKDSSKELAIAASHLASQVWETYAYGARILTCDAPYEAEVPRWTYGFNQSVLSLKESIEPFYLAVIKRYGKEIGEETLSKRDFVSKMIDLKRDGRLLWIRSERPSNNIDKIARLIAKDVAGVPEFDYFLRGDPFDFPIINKLNEDVLRQALDFYAEAGRFYVAYKDPTTGIRHITFKVAGNESTISRTLTV